MMKLQRTFSPMGGERRDEKQYTVADALRKNLDRGHDTHHIGQLEVLEETAGSAVNTLGELISLLHDKGLLAAEDVCKIVGLGWEPVERDG